MKRAEGWELSFLFFFKRAFFMGGEGKRGVMPHPFKRAFFYRWGGKRGVMPHLFQRDFFSCPFGKEMERCFFSSAGTFSMRGCFLIDMSKRRGLVVSRCKG